MHSIHTDTPLLPHCQLPVKRLPPFEKKHHSASAARNATPNTRIAAITTSHHPSRRRTAWSSASCARRLISVGSIAAKRDISTSI